MDATTATEQPVQDGAQGHHAPLDPTKYKTKLCRNFAQKGHCAFGDSCSFAHGPHDLHNFNPMQHQPHQPPVHPPRFKTRLCRHFQSNGQCPYMDKCGFAHGEAELNTAQPSGPSPMHRPFAPYHHLPFESFYNGGHKRQPAQELIKTRLCKHFSSTGSCPYDTRCLFAHGQVDLRPRMMMPTGVVGAMPVVQHHVPMVSVVPPASGVHWSGPQWTQQYAPATAYMPSQ